jgi:hypothetical protein
MRAAAGAIYRPRSRGRGKISGFCRVSPVPNARVTSRPGDLAIGRAIGLSVRELVTARVEIAGNRALVGLLAIFFVQESN